MTNGDMRMYDTLTIRSREREQFVARQQEARAMARRRDRGGVRDDRRADDAEFRRVYASVERENREARASATRGEGAPRSSSIDASREQSRAMHETSRDRSADAASAHHRDISPKSEEFDGARRDGADEPLASETVKQAWSIIRESLTTISEAFDLNLAGRLEELEANTPAESVIAEFAEILTVLRSMTAMLREAGDEGIALSVPGRQIESVDASALGKQLQAEAFRLELAFSMLGVAGEVAGQGARKEDASFFTGIPVAADPAALESQPNVGTIVSDLFSESENKVEAIIARLAGLAETRDVKKSALSVSASPGETGSHAGSNQFDSGVLRRILKIDTETDASGGDNSDSRNGGNASARGVMPKVQPQTSALFSQPLEGADIGAEAAAEAGGRSQPLVQHIDASPKFTPVAGRALEESVMAQMTDKLHTAIRNGVHEVRIHLRPESLGEVHLKIQLDGDVVMARIQVENQQVKQIVESNLQSLRDSLSEHNLQTGAFDVNVNRGSEQENPFAGTGQTGGGSGEKTGMSARGAETDGHEVDIGRETGRRWGSNSVEYFA